jgi:hypothetical protein
VELESVTVNRELQVLRHSFYLAQRLRKIFSKNQLMKPEFQKVQFCLGFLGDKKERPKGNFTQIRSQDEL